MLFQGLTAIDASQAFAGLEDEQRVRFAVEWYFRTRSYSADLTPLFSGSDPIAIVVVIRGTSDTVDEGLPEVVGKSLAGSKPFEISLPVKYWDLEEAIDRVPRGTRKPTKIPSGSVSAAGNIGKFDANFVWISKFSTREDFASLLRNPGLKAQPSPEEYESLFSKMNGIYVAIGARDRLRDIQCADADRFVAVNGVPSAHNITTPQRGGLGYIQNIHCVVDVGSRPVKWCKSASSC